jgi:hypothetical protein
MELAAHASGQYPPWWQGYKFDRAIRAWAAVETTEVVRATIQLLLLGEPGQHGTGCIPKSALVEVLPARGPADLADGMSTVVKRYLLDKSLDRHVTTMTLDDAAHYSAEDKAGIAAQYPDHERDTRTKGVPRMGSGRVFLVGEEKLLVDPFECPRHWVRVGGLDPGWTHFAAFCECWWDLTLTCFIWSEPYDSANKRCCSTSMP